MSATFSFPIEKSDKNAKVRWAAIEFYRREKECRVRVRVFYGIQIYQSRDKELQDFKSGKYKKTRNRKRK